MAHVKKYAKGNVQGLSIHWDRKTENHSNQDIDNERSHLNYDLCEKEGDTLSRMNDRLSEVHCLNRKNVKVCADWAVTLPESLKDASETEQRKFFEKTYEFLANRYGGKKMCCQPMYIMMKQDRICILLLCLLFGMRKSKGKRFQLKKC
ncbi:plasmid recombination protein [Bacillus tropicus]|uniref:plasmid recombination protein n=1 Tax=Bacillus tropicus TaxID=2026188 RepID=UPI002E22AEEA|nr:plasmid recombination protein [Bacillus tropicus]